MSDLINKYAEQYSEFIDELVQLHSLHLRFSERQSPRRTLELRRSLKRARRTLFNIEKLAQERMKERRVEWITEHPDKLRKNRNE